MEDIVLNPCRFYDSHLKKLHEENTNAYFEKLVQKSKIDVDENILTVKKYKESLKKIENLKKKINRSKFFRKVMLIQGILFIAFLIIAIFLEVTNPFIYIAFVFASGLGFFGFYRFYKMLNKLHNKLLEEEAISSELLSKCWQQMEPLNNTYNWKMAADIIKKTVPIINIDPYFSGLKFTKINKHYNFSENNFPTKSTNVVHLGNISGNPFLYLRYYNQKMEEKEYHGQRILTYTTTIRTSDGGIRKEEKQEVLTAHVTKLVPKYYFSNELLYFNDVASNLSFSRDVTGLKGKTKRDIEKYIKDRSKELEKESRLAVSKGKNFVLLSNMEFEALFGAQNRDNEIEFRVLFTPLAQQNMVDLIKMNAPYGDDFKLEKKGQLTKVSTEHSVNYDYSTDPTQFVTFDYEEAKKKFFEYNQEFFKSLYFDLAPILSIPEFQLPNPNNNIKGLKVESNLSPYEHEYIANLFNSDELNSPEAETPCINKIKLIDKINNFDYIRIYSYAFKTIERVETVRTKNHDGILYDVDVPYLEYVPVMNTTDVVIGMFGLTQQEIKELKENDNFNNFVRKYTFNEKVIFSKGCIVYATNPHCAKESINALDIIINEDIG